MCVLPLLSGGISSWRQGRGNPLRHTTTHTDTGVSLDSPSSSTTTTTTSMPLGLLHLLLFILPEPSPPAFPSQAWSPLICSFSLVHLFFQSLSLFSSLLSISLLSPFHLPTFSPPVSRTLNNVARRDTFGQLEQEQTITRDTSFLSFSHLRFF